MHHKIGHAMQIAKLIILQISSVSLFSLSKLKLKDWTLISKALGESRTGCQGWDSPSLQFHSMALSQQKTLLEIEKV